MDTDYCFAKNSRRCRLQRSASGADVSNSSRTYTLAFPAERVAVSKVRQLSVSVARKLIAVQR